MKKLIVGNWKMNPETPKAAQGLIKSIKRKAEKIKNAELVICPPFIYLSAAQKILGHSKIALGSQDIFWEAEGAYTGELSGPMLRELGVKFSIIGHSERRTLGETDEMINKKTKAALKNKIIPIICVGERERDSHGYFLAAVKKQIEHAFAGVPAVVLKNCVIAYEPIWAVGNKSFKSASPHDAVEMNIFIKKTLADRYGPRRVHDVRILYGGSVSEKNATDFLSEKDIAGLLVGRESLDAGKFLGIARAD